MDPFQLQVQAVIRAAYPDAQVEFETVPGGHLGGTVISESFTDLSQSDRNRALWSILRNAFAEDSTRLTTFLTFTPDEVREMDQVMAA